MSIRDYNKVLIITNEFDGSIIDTIQLRNYDKMTIRYMIMDLFEKYVLNNDYNISIKFGYKNL